MAAEELFAEIGMSADDAARFAVLEEEHRYREQERLLRKYRDMLLEGVHRGEKLISDIDYLIYEIHKNENK